MFNIGMNEIIIILLVAFLVVGPKDLPKVARWLGRQLGRLRRLIKELKKEVGWDEIEKEIKDASREVKDIGNEVKTISKDLDVRADVREALKDVEKEVNAADQDLKAEQGKIKRELSSAGSAVEETKSIMEANAQAVRSAWKQEKAAKLPKKEEAPADAPQQAAGDAAPSEENM